jgi:hypothetical protein
LLKALLQCKCAAQGCLIAALLHGTNNFYKDKTIVLSGTKNNTGGKTFYLNGLRSF